MSSWSPPVAVSGLPLAEIGWLAAGGVLAGVAAIAALAWLLWRAQRDYAVELAAQARLLADAEENVARAQQEKETLIRDGQAKSEMLATLSREIRAHLNGIIGSADLMVDASLKPPQREHLATLRASAESLHQALNDVLDFSAIDAGQIQIARAPFDVRQPLIDVVETVSPLALLKKLELVLIVAPDVPVSVSGDAARLRQVLVNLMANAVKFTAQGRVVLRVELPHGSAAPSTKGGTWLHFSVSDTGVGLSEELQATIFERAPATGSVEARRFGGSGLELAISKRLVELMGGRIGARGVPEGGTEFWLVLPLALERETPAAPAPLGDFHVVVLDDLAAARIAAAAMLSRLGLEHDVTDSLAKAEELLHEVIEDGRQPVLLLDETFLTPGSDALTRWFEPNSPMRGTRVLLLAQNPDGMAAASLPFPVAAILRKPLLRAELLVQTLQAKAAIVAEAKAPTGHRPHVLVVDDDAISRSVSSQLLERLGCFVELAVSGPEAIELARTNPFNLIFMDCQMPDMDGFTTTQKIRAQANGKAPPIVALTANISEADRERCFAVGMCDFVAKPVKRAELQRVLKSWTTAAATNGK